MTIPAITPTIPAAIIAPVLSFSLMTVPPLEGCGAGAGDGAGTRALDGDGVYDGLRDGVYDGDDSVLPDAAARRACLCSGLTALGASEMSFVIALLQSSLIYPPSATHAIHALLSSGKRCVNASVPE